MVKEFTAPWAHKQILFFLWVYLECELSQISWYKVKISSTVLSENYCELKVWLPSYLKCKLIFFFKREPWSKNLLKLSVGFMHYLWQRPYLITLSVNQSGPRAATSCRLLTSTAGDETPSEAVKTQRTCGIPVIMQLSALHRRVMKAKMKSLLWNPFYSQSNVIHAPCAISWWSVTCHRASCCPTIRP